MGRKLLIVLVVLTILAAVAIWQRHRILLPAITTGAQIPQLLDANPTPGGEPMGEPSTSQWFN